MRHVLKHRALKVNVQLHATAPFNQVKSLQGLVRQEAPLSTMTW
jgi:hypothetical protein